RDCPIPGTAVRKRNACRGLRRKGNNKGAHEGRLVEGSAFEYLCCDRASGNASRRYRGQQDATHVAGWTAIIGAGGQCFGPHLFVSDPMVADDANAFKFLLQGFDISKGG